MTVMGWADVGTGSAAVTAGSVLDVLALLASFIWGLLHTCSLSNCFNMVCGNSRVFAFSQP